MEFVLNSNVVKINGETKVESIDVQNNDGTTRTIDTNALFIAIGQEPRNEIFSNLVKIDSHGYIESEDGVHTETPGVYVAGDARVKTLRQLVTATSDGAIAADIAIKEFMA